jgi:hypothetical protein
MLTRMSQPPAVARWHEVARTRDPAQVEDQLEDLLDEDCVFRSPAVHTPQEGKAITTAYLTAAMHVLGPTLTYVREWYAERSAVLEFTADLDGTTVHGIDMLDWDDQDRLVGFTVMVRPFKGLTTLMEQMAEQLRG